MWKKMRVYRLILLYFSVFYSVIACSAALAKCDNDHSEEMASHLNIGPYQYRMNYNPDNDEGYFQILRKGKVLLSKKGSHFYINSKEKDCEFPVAGSSVTKEHRHELVVKDWSGGAHCCFILYIIALGKKPYLIQKINMEHTDSPRFIDLDGDGIPEIQLLDGTFAYWNIAFAQSPAPVVTLKYDGKKWIFAKEIMTKQKMTMHEFSKIKKDVISHFQRVQGNAFEGDTITGVPVMLWEEMLNFIYSGQASLAFRLIQESWPLENPNKEVFLTEFKKQFEFKGTFLSKSYLTWIEISN
jgi:hypothetical protein